MTSLAIVPAIIGATATFYYLNAEGTPAELAFDVSFKRLKGSERKSIAQALLQNAEIAQRNTQRAEGAPAEDPALTVTDLLQRVLKGWDLTDYPCTPEGWAAAEEDYPGLLDAVENAFWAGAWSVDAVRAAAAKNLKAPPAP